MVILLSLRLADTLLLWKGPWEVRLSGRCVGWLSLPSTSTQIDTASRRKFQRVPFAPRALLGRRVVAAAEVWAHRRQPLGRHHLHLQRVVAAVAHLARGRGSQHGTGG